MDECTSQTKVRAMSDCGSQSDSSFEARQPQAQTSLPTTDAPSPRVNLEEAKDE